MRAMFLWCGAVFYLCVSAHAQPCEPEVSDAFPAPATGWIINDIATFSGASGPEIWTVGVGLRVPGNEGWQSCIRWSQNGFEPIALGTGGLRTIVLVDSGGDEPPTAYVGSGTAVRCVRDGVFVQLPPAPGGVSELVPAADGSGLFFMAGGTTGVYGWDGVAWQHIGDPIDDVQTILEHGGNLYAGTLDGTVLKKEGESWRTLGIADGEITAFAIDPADGESLIVGGRFTTMDGTPVSGIALFGNEVWSDLDGGLDGEPEDLATITVDGVTLVVAAGAPLDSAEWYSMSAWDGSAWREIPGHGGMDRAVAMATVELDGETALVAAADHSFPGLGLFSLWNGESWRIVSNGIGGFGSVGGLQTPSVTQVRRGAGPDGDDWLYLVGDFGPAALMSARSWRTMASGFATSVGKGDAGTSLSWTWQYLTSRLNSSSLVSSRYRRT